MKTQLGNQDDGLIGLGVLVLMTIALVASQLGGERDVAVSRTAAPAFEMALGGEQVPVRPVAIRELEILPSFINEPDKFNWSSDEELLDRYQNRGF